MEELTKFNAKRKFRAAVVASVWSVRMDSQSALSGLVSKPFSKEEVTALRSAFHAKKSGGSDGRVTREQFADVMSSIGFGDLPLDKMFSVFGVLRAPVPPCRAAAHAQLAHARGPTRS